jgi:hypothetical protein
MATSNPFATKILACPDHTCLVREVSQAFADKVFAHLNFATGDGSIGRPFCRTVSGVRIFGRFAVVTYDAVEDGKEQEWNMVFYLDVAVWVLPVTVNGYG